MKNANINQEATCIAFMWNGILAAYTYQGIKPPKWTWPHIKVAQDIAEHGSSTKGSLAIYNMIEAAKRYEDIAIERLGKRLIMAENVEREA